MSSWYFNKNLKPQGPISFDDVKKKIMRGEVGPTDLLSKDGEAAWLAASEWREFTQELFPAFQKNYFKTSTPEEKEWILLTFNQENPQGLQVGPHSVEEISEMLLSAKAGLKISAEDYVWRSGLTGWVQIKDRPEFSTAVNSLSISPDL